MTQAIKVYQIADALGMDYDTVVARIRAFGIPVNNKMSKIDGDVAEQIKSSLLKDKQQDWVEIDMGNGVRKRVRKPSAVVAPAPIPTVHPEPMRARVPAPTRSAEPVRREEVFVPVSSPPATPSVSPTESMESLPPVQHVQSAPLAPSSVSEVVEPPSASRPTTVAESAALVEVAAPPPPPPPPPPVLVEPAPVTPVAATPAARVPVPPAVPATVEPVTTAPSVSTVSSQEATQPVPARVALSAEPTASVQSRAPSAPAPVNEQRIEAAAPPSLETPSIATTSVPPPREFVSSMPSMPSTTPTSSVLPPSGSARPVPSTPAPKTGTVVWDPTTKSTTHIQSAPGRTRSIQVDPKRLEPQRPVQRGGMQSRGPTGPNRMGPGGRRTPMRGPVGIKGPAPTPTQMGAHKRVVKIEGQIALQELARRMAVKGTEVMFKLLGMGMAGVNINSTLDADTAKLVAQEFQYEVSDVAVADDDALKAILPEFKEQTEDVTPRPPVVTVMGHVDHGKTTLLDAILGMRVAEGEAGGITQKVSAYRVETSKGPVVFFDTPGHEAFTKLRARGAVTTDVAVLVVAADDGVMPTTVEAINHAKAANVPIVVAMNKMDKPDAKPERVIQQLMSHDVVPEEYGGDTLVVQVSAKQKTGVDQLLESLALQTEILDLRANPKKAGRGTVFDATLDKGRGVVARILVQDGTIRTGDVVLSGTSYGKIRAMFDDRGKSIAKAGPSTPIEIQGLSEVPAAGDAIYVVQDLKKAQAFAEERRIKTSRLPASNPGLGSLEEIQQYLARGETVTIGVIIKAEAQASVEALSKALQELSTDKVKLQILHTGIGGITETDVNLAVASKAVIIGFNVRPQGKTASLAESEKIQILLYNIIYEAVDEIKALMVGQLKPTLVEKSLGKAEVRQVFHITKVGQVAGCYVTEGLIKRTARARLVRDSMQVWEGKLASLRRFKDDAKEVATGYECGIGLENYNDVKPNDIIEAFEIEEVAAKL